MISDQEQQFGPCIFREANDLFFIVHPSNLRVVEVNPAAQRLTGYRRKQLLEMNLPDLFESACAERVGSLVQACRTTSHLAACEDFWMKTATDPVPVQVTASRIHTEREPLGLLVVRDLSKQKRLEEALRASEERYRRIVQGVQDIVWGVSVGNDLRHWPVSFVSEQVTPLLGYRPEDFLADDSLWWKSIAPEDQPMMEASLRELAQGARSLTRQYRLRHKLTGEYRWLEDRFAAQFDETGKLVSLCGVALRDVTERKRVEDRYQSVVEGSLQGIIIHQDDRIRYVNPAFLGIFGYTTPEELLGRECLRTLVVPADVLLLQGRIDSIYKGESLTPHNGWRGLRKDGSIIWLTSYGSRIEWEGRPAVLSFAIDITERRREEEERKRLELRIQQAQKLESLGVLAGGIAHDFNNLLTAILGHAELALMRLPPLARERTHLDQIVVGVHRAAELTNQILAYAGKSRAVFQPQSLSVLVRGMVDLLEVSISKKARLQCHLAGTLPPIEADAAQLRQVILNLILNASEALEDRAGTISVRTELRRIEGPMPIAGYSSQDLPVAEYACLEVSDTGCGMSGEILERIFEPFFTTKFTGRGLGLASVQGIVRSHRGAIQVASKPGQGTTFLVYFPLSTKPLPSPEATVPIAWRGEGTILVVDDEQAIRSLSQLMLQGFGFQVITAQDGFEAVEIYRAQQERITAVLLDLTMPGLDGVETYRRLLEMNDEIRIVLTSGYGEQAARERLVGMKPVKFIPKPYDPEQLKRVLREAIEGSPVGDPDATNADE